MLGFNLCDTQVNRSQIRHSALSVVSVYDHLSHLCNNVPLVAVDGVLVAVDARLNSGAVIVRIDEDLAFRIFDPVVTGICHRKPN